VGRAVGAPAPAGPAHQVHGHVADADGEDEVADRCHLVDHGDGQGVVEEAQRVRRRLHVVAVTERQVGDLIGGRDARCGDGRRTHRHAPVHRHDEQVAGQPHRHDARAHQGGVAHGEDEQAHVPGGEDHGPEPAERDVVGDRLEPHPGRQQPPAADPPGREVPEVTAEQQAEGSADQEGDEGERHAERA
jgi:hypothetical protein